MHRQPFFGVTCPSFWLYACGVSNTWRVIRLEGIEAGGFVNSAVSANQLFGLSYYKLLDQLQHEAKSRTIVLLPEISWKFHQRYLPFFSRSPSFRTRSIKLPIFAQLLFSLSQLVLLFSLILIELNYGVGSWCCKYI